VRNRLNTNPDGAGRLGGVEILEREIERAEPLDDLLNLSARRNIFKKPHGKRRVTGGEIDGILTSPLEVIAVEIEA
jgi:hypothetical protein